MHQYGENNLHTLQLVYVKKKMQVSELVEIERGQYLFISRVIIIDKCVTKMQYAWDITRNTTLKSSVHMIAGG